ncbi:MAG: cytochrome c [Xanthomonadales bacterium]|nr:cytochrome c [Xanthomonadales bacterium]
MRERWARRLALLTCLLVLGLTAAFAAVRNLPVTLGAASHSAVDPGAAEDTEAAVLALGRQVYDQNDCAACHAIAGTGSPRSPLDGVGSALAPAQIREWVIGGDSIAEDLSPRALRTKQAYRSLPAEQLDALVAYLSSLKD